MSNPVINNESNNLPSTVIEVIEEIIEKLENEVSVQPIEKCDSPVLKTPVEVTAVKIIEPCKTISPSLEKTVEDGKKTQEQREKLKPKRCVTSPVSVPAFSEKQCKSLQVAAILSKPKQKVNKNEPKFKDKNSLFKYGNYNR